MSGPQYLSLSRRGRKASAKAPRPSSAALALLKPPAEAGEVLDLSAPLRVRPEQLAHLSDLADRAAELASRSRSASTRRVYATQWRNLEAWMAEKGWKAFPTHPQALALYLTERSPSVSLSTVEQVIAAVSLKHKEAGLESPIKDPEVQRVWEGIARDKGRAPKRRAAPLNPLQLRELCACCSPRDKALLLLGFAGGRRRSELVALELEDVVELADEGLVVTVRRSKTDQEGRGLIIGIPFGSDKMSCPVRAWREHLAVRGVAEGKAFLSKTGKPLHGTDVSRIIRRAAKKAGFDPKFIEKLSAHALRSGFATSAAKAGKSLVAIADQGGWKTLEVLRGYIREADFFKDNPASGIGL